MSWSAPAWVGQSDKDYSDLIRKKAEAVTRRDKRRGGKYSVKEAIEAIHQAFHRCNGLIPTTAPSWIQSCWAPTAMSEVRRGVLLTSGSWRCCRPLITSQQSGLLTFKSSAGRPMTPRGTCPLRSSSLTATGLLRSQNSIDLRQPTADKGINNKAVVLSTQW